MTVVGDVVGVLFVCFPLDVACRTLTRKPVRARGGYGDVRSGEGLFVGREGEDYEKQEARRRRSDKSKEARVF